MTYQDWYALMTAEGWRVIGTDDTGCVWQHQTAGTKKALFTLDGEGERMYWLAGLTPPPF